MAKADDTIMVTCRSGGRSAIAVNMLAKGGFKNAYNIVDGVEGDSIDDPDKWTYKLTADRMVLSKVVR